MRPKTLGLRVGSRQLCAIGLLVATFSLVMCTGAGAASDAASPLSYTKTVCAAIAKAAKAGARYSQAITNAGRAYGTAPTPDTAAALRDVLVTTYTGISQQSAGVLDTVRAAGIPAVKNGAAFAKAFTERMQVIHTQADTLAGQVAALDVTNASQFGASFQQLADQAKQDGDATRAATKADPRLKNMPPSLRPLAAVLTHDSDKCKRT